MERQIAFIGAGNMGGALLGRVCAQTDPRQVALHRRTETVGMAQAAMLGCVWESSGAAAVKGTRYIMLCVKPQGIWEVLGGLLPAMREEAAAGRRQVLVSIAAGVTIAALEEKLAAAGLDLPVIRVMPNTPVALGEGVVLISPGRSATEEDHRGIAALLEGCGLIERVDERQLDLGCALSGCGPAFVYMFIEALADGGVEIGLPRSLAQTWAAQTVLGAAEMALKTGEHPGALKDAVCSPGGATIAGVAALERRAFRAAAAGAVKAAYERSSRLG